MSVYDDVRGLRDQVARLERELADWRETSQCATAGELGHYLQVRAAEDTAMVARAKKAECELERTQARVQEAVERNRVMNARAQTAIALEDAVLEWAAWSYGIPIGPPNGRRHPFDAVVAAARASRAAREARDLPGRTITDDAATLSADQLDELVRMTKGKRP